MLLLGASAIEELLPLAKGIEVVEQSSARGTVSPSPDPGTTPDLMREKDSTEPPFA